jgi:hypothetical protein
MTTATLATNELQGRIRGSNLEESLTTMACNLCIDGVSIDEAFSRLQDKALEQIVGLLDTRILHDALAMKNCMELVAGESERVAWKALEKGTEMLSEGLAILDEIENLPACGPVN